jgi:hypothetical protein
VTQYPSQYVALAERFYAQPEELSVASMSGGALDTGTFTPRHRTDADMVMRTVSTTSNLLGDNVYYSAASSPAPLFRDAAAERTVNMRSGVPWFRDFENRGFADRFERLGSFLRDNGDAANANNQPQKRYTGANDVTVFTITERIPASPFITWKARDRTRRLLNTRRFKFKVKLFDDWRDKLFQAKVLAGNNNDVTVKLTAVTLYLRWVVPPKTQPLPPRHTMPWLFYEMHSSAIQTVTDALFPAAAHHSATFTFKLQIRRSTFPKRLFLAVRPPPTATGLVDSPEHHMELLAVDFTVDAHGGRLGKFTTCEMFALYVRNTPVSRLRDFDYEEWRKRYCTLALRDEDIGWDFESCCGRIITIVVTARSNWQLPSVGLAAQERLDVGRDYRLDVVVENEYQMIMDKRRCELVRR